MATDATQTVEDLFKRGREAYERVDLPDAEAALRAALALAPGNPAVRAALGSTLLKAGHLAEGFRHFDAWREMPGRAVAPRLPFPLWRGQPVAGKRVLIWSEDGLGDQIMYGRFAKALVERGADVSWLCPRALATLFGHSLGVTALPADEDVDLVGFDFYCPSSALPLGFDLTLATVPGSPYLDAPPRPVEARIGVMLEGNTRNVSGAPRALGAEARGRMLSLPGAMSLDPRDTGVATFMETAAIIAGLDLVISVDTSVAHLAGAMGRPVWVLLPYVSDWRWLAAGGTTPWYPSARLWRQPAPGDWPAVVDGVLQALS